MFKKLVDSIKRELILNRYPIIIFSFSRAIIITVIILTSLYSLGTPNILAMDARSYLQIAQNGYTFNGDYHDEGSYIAFFPLFPIIVRFVSLAGIDLIFSAIIVNFIFGLFSSILLYKLTVNQFGDKAGIAAVFLFSFFPTSIFLTVPYTESLFLFLSLLTLYFIDKKNFLSASIFTGLALVARPTGIILLLILMVYLIKDKSKSFLTPVYLLISLIPFSLFLLYQYKFYNTPFAFMIAENINWHHEATFPWIGFSNFLHYGVFSNNLSIMWGVDFFFLLLMIITLILATKTVKPVFLLFGWGVVLLTLSQTYILGLSRFMLVVIPFYMYWGNFLKERSVTKMLIFCLFSSWLVFDTILFILYKQIY
jgi:Gpi18-like mannosyltransferase